MAQEWLRSLAQALKTRGKHVYKLIDGDSYLDARTADDDELLALLIKRNEAQELADALETARKATAQLLATLESQGIRPTGS